MRVLVLCGTFALGVVAWACYTAGPWPESGAVSSFPAASGTRAGSAAESPPEADLRWHSPRWSSASPTPRPVLARGGRFVRRVSGAAASSAVQVQPTSSRRRKVPRGAVAPEPGGSARDEKTVSQGALPPEEEQAELQLAQEFFAAAGPDEPVSAPRGARAASASQPAEADVPATAGPPLQVMGPDAVEVILSLTDRFRNSVLRGSVFDPTGDPEQVEALSRELVHTIWELQAQQPAAAEAAPAPLPAQVEAKEATPVPAPHVVEANAVEAAAVSPPGMDPEHELVVRALREAARHLDEAANDLEWSARYHLADLLRQTATELRHRAREFQPPRD